MKTTRRLLPALLLLLLRRAAADSGLSTASAACVSDQCRVDLSPELTLLYQVHLPDDFEFYEGDPEHANHGWRCRACKVSVRLSLSGASWIGFGPSRRGETIGSRVVVGKPGYGTPRDYYLRGEEAELIDGPMDPVSEEDDGSGGLSNKTIEYVGGAIGGRTVMGFDMAFAPWGFYTRLGPILNNEYTFVWAHGGDGEVIPQEVEVMGRRAGKSGWTPHTVDNLLGFAPDVIDDARRRFPSAKQAGGSAVGGSAVGGVMSVVLGAFGVLVVLAVALWPRRQGGGWVGVAKEEEKEGHEGVELAEKRPPPDEFNDSQRSVL